MEVISTNAEAKHHSEQRAAQTSGKNQSNSGLTGWTGGPLVGPMAPLTALNELSKNAPEFEIRPNEIRLSSNFGHRTTSTP